MLLYDYEDARVREHVYVRASGITAVRKSGKDWTKSNEMHLRKMQLLGELLCGQFMCA